MAMVRFTSSHSQTDKKNCHKVVQYNLFSFLQWGLKVLSNGFWELLNLRLDHFGDR